jgi:hypothetical protein
MAEIISKTQQEITIQLTIKLTGSMLEMEQAIQTAVNDVGCISTKEALSKFDTTGSPINIGSIKLTTKGKAKKEYETPYGTVVLERHIYQSPDGGKTFCPLDDRARIIIHSTPKFAKMISYKYSSLSAKDVAQDLEQNHSRHIARGFVQKIADMVGAIAQATEEDWDYEIPQQIDMVANVSISLDGTCILMKEQGYREAMTGNISLYNQLGERLHTIYVGAAPEYGKHLFLDRLQTEVNRVKQKYPNANYVGIADGASNNWIFLEPNTEYHILDFYHATEYLADASYSFSDDESKRKAWLAEACHKLKHDNQSASAILKEMKNQADKNITNRKISKAVKEDLQKAITYFTNQLPRMNYHQYRSKNLPIGSGVTEAACKTLIKQRLCKSAMQWKDRGARIVIALRSLVQTSGRWGQFWQMVNHNGLSGVEVRLGH